jgi:hypothetical protein
MLRNISTRLSVGTGDNAMIGGFIITGPQPKTVIVRGIGPSLPMPGRLADPVIEFHDSAPGHVVTNDNWRDGQYAKQVANTLPPANDLESALWGVINPGAYTVIVRGKNDASGIGLFEVYDLDQTVDSKLANISTRGFVQTADNVMIGGFILSGLSNTHVVVRGIGPSLSQSGLSNVLADPTLELRDSNGILLGANDNWQDDPAAAGQLTAHGLAPPDPKESGIFATLPLGAFTAILAGKNGGTGIGLVEIYNLQ